MFYCKINCFLFSFDGFFKFGAVHGTFYYMYLFLQLSYYSFERSEQEEDWRQTYLLQLNNFRFADFTLCGFADFSRESSRMFLKPHFCIFLRDIHVTLIQYFPRIEFLLLGIILSWVNSCVWPYFILLLIFFRTAATAVFRTKLEACLLAELRVYSNKETCF